MENEQDKTTAALQSAIQMEKDGKKFYLNASQASSNELGKALLKSLADEEDVHRQKFEEIYEAIRSQKAWPKTDFQPDGGMRLRTLFIQTGEKLGSAIKVPATELDAVQTAMNLESKTYDFYKTQSEKATYQVEKEFYVALATQEKEHHLILLDYYEYLKDPAAWFTSKEHPSLDAG